MSLEWPDGAAVGAWRVGDDDVAALVAQGLIVDYCNWHIAPVEEEVELLLDGSGTRVQEVPSLKLTTVHALTELRVGFGVPSAPGTPVALTPDVDFEWSENGTLTKIGCPATGAWWTPRPRAIAITITHGYASLPPAVLAVALSVAARSGSSGSGDVSEQRGPFAKRRATTADGEVIGAGLTDLEKAALRRYRIIAVS